MATARKKTAQTRTQALAALMDKTLLPDLRERAKEPAVREALEARWAFERKRQRTAATFDEWIDQTLEQVAAGWVLSAVFVRVLEDRGLLAQRRIAGGDAADGERLFLELFPALGPREYLWAAFREAARFPGVEEVLAPRVNPAFRLGVSQASARALLDLLREADASGALRWRFDDQDTRFLGDLYQDLSASVRERFALLQTPDFVERFILERTLEPAVKEFGLKEVRMIDPTCGSGHFLLGGFQRLLEHHRRERPGAEVKRVAEAALAQVYGSDVNPYAVAIARFRLLLAYLEACGIARLEDAPRLPMLASNVVVADSLLLGGKGTRELSELAESAEAQASWGPRGFDFVDPPAVNNVFRQRFHAVVGNPPYITCKDEALRDRYRERYPNSAYRLFALGAPFTERFFELAVPGGHVGLINANSFMKREFGRPLIESVLRNLDLTTVIDTSGAFIPGHGTPTVILFGRNAKSSSETVRAVLGKRGEPETPAEPQRGRVWTSIVENIERAGAEDEFVSVADVSRETFSKHPWSLGGGGAGELKELIERKCDRRLQDCVALIGFGAVTREDDAYLVGEGAARRMGVAAAQIRPLVAGEEVRDWTIASTWSAIWPYDPVTLAPVSGDAASSVTRALWPLRTQLSSRVAYGETQLGRGLQWFEYSMYFRERFRAPLSIAFAEVSTHNHFVLDRGGKVFNRTAPIIKLPGSATEDDHFALLAWLNSSIACFYLKQISMNKGSQGINEGLKSEAWEQFYQFSGGKIAAVPFIKAQTAVELARWMDEIARLREADRPNAAAILNEEVAYSRAVFDEHRRLAEDALERLCALQEDIDFLFYEQLGLLTPEDLAALRSATQLCPPPDDDRYAISPGHRPFELLLADEARSQSRPTAWFTRNGYLDPTTHPLPDDHPLRPLILARRAVIERNPHLRLIERPEYKRRWTLTDWDAEVRDATTRALLDAAETAARASTTAISTRELTTALLRDARLHAIAALRFPGDDDLPARVADLIPTDAVPYLAPLRFTADGLAKRALWEHTWALQRREDAGETLPSPIPVPPKYDREDYSDPRYWSLRGRLDVPRERFISYPGAELDPKNPIFGWAGWDHLQRAQALARLYQQRKDEDGWDTARLTPLLAGLHELVPWLLQWHNEPDADGVRHGDAWKEFVEGEVASRGLTLEQLRAWRPAAPTRAERAKPTASRATAKRAATTSTPASSDAAPPEPKPARKPARSRTHKPPPPKAPDA